MFDLLRTDLKPRFAILLVGLRQIVHFSRTVFEFSLTCGECDQLLDRIRIDSQFDQPTVPKGPHG